MNCVLLGHYIESDIAIPLSIEPMLKVIIVLEAKGHWECTVEEYGRNI